MHSYLVLLFSIIYLSVQAQQGIKAPKATEKPLKFKIHDKEMQDEFSWLRNLKDPAVIEHLNNENAYVDAMMFGTLEMQKTLKEEHIARIEKEKKTPPFIINNYAYYFDRKEGQSYSSLYRQDTAGNGASRIMIDVNQLATQYPYFRLFDFKISPDNNWIAYRADTLGSNEGVLFIRNIRGKDLIKVNARVSHMEWMANSRDIIYSLMNDEWRNDKIIMQNINNLQNSYKILLEEKDALYGFRMTKSRSGKYIFIQSQSFNANENYVLETSQAIPKPYLFRKRTQGSFSYLEHSPLGFLLLHNDDNPDYSLSLHPEKIFQKESLVSLIKPAKERYIYKVEAFQDFIALHIKSNARLSIQLVDYKGLELARLQPDDKEGNVRAGENFMYDTKVYRYKIGSLKRPEEIYDYHIDEKRHLLIDKEKINNYSPEDYEEQLLFVTAADGEQIPLSIYHKKNLNRNGQNPCLLYGYGAYGYGTFAGFNPYLLSLLDRGFIYAIAHVRGGDEKGYTWYEAGKMKQKMNSFKDYIAVAEFLVNQQYTSPSRLIAQGGSAGGLLMGAVVNMRPELFRAVHLKVPFVDVINTMMDETLPLSTAEFLQWGNPKVKEDFDYILQYSPYENVKKQKYPLLLFTSGLHDKQVGCWEPAKMVARIRKLNPDALPVLFKCEMKSGHGGSAALFSKIDEIAFEQAFFLSSVGISK